MFDRHGLRISKFRAASAMLTTGDTSYPSDANCARARTIAPARANGQLFNVSQLRGVTTIADDQVFKSVRNVHRQRDIIAQRRKVLPRAVHRPCM